MHESLVVQQPVNPGAKLLLLFHGVGGTPADMVPLAQRMAHAAVGAAIVSVASPFAYDIFQGGQGGQWFSVMGITETNRAGRIAQALPLFSQTVRDWQARFSIAPASTTLIGFSQGAIIALESARNGYALAGQIVSFAGRFAVLPDHPLLGTTIDFIHGDVDAVVPASHAVLGSQTVKALGGHASSVLLPATGHELTDAMVDVALQKIRAAVYRP